MYNVYDISVEPNKLIEETIGFSEQECIEWIKINGDATKYTIVKE